MPFLTRRCIPMISAVVLLAVAGTARAELVVMTSGRTFPVTSHRVEGNVYVFETRTGGEITCDRSLVAGILPREVPDPEPGQGSGGGASDAAPAPSPTVVPPSPYGELVASMARAHGVDPMLVHAVITVESNYRPTARSHKGAMGLMQLMPETARRYNVRNPYDPAANIAAGVKHLRMLIDRWGGIELALAAYNAGEGAVQKFKGIPPYRETRKYVTRILAIAGLQ